MENTDIQYDGHKPIKQNSLRISLSLYITFDTHAHKRREKQTGQNDINWQWYIEYWSACSWTNNDGQFMISIEQKKRKILFFLTKKNRFALCYVKNAWHLRYCSLLGAKFLMWCIKLVSVCFDFRCYIALSLSLFMCVCVRVSWCVYNLSSKLTEFLWRLKRNPVFLPLLEKNLSMDIQQPHNFYISIDAWCRRLFNKHTQFTFIPTD